MEAQSLPADNRETPGHERLASIDVLRGLDMFFLTGAGGILLNLSGAINSDALMPVENQLRHVAWTGFSAWDIIMPLFLFTTGLSMPFSFSKFMRQGRSKAQLYVKILKRFMLLFLLGWIVQGRLLDLNPDTFHVYCNTLHAIAFGYLITALIILNIPKVSMQLLTGASLVAAYWLLMTFVPVPGSGRGVFTPEGNLAIYIDHAVFGRFDDGTQYTWLLTSLGFGATVFSGYYAGWILQRPAGHNEKLKRLSLIGAALVLGGLLWSLQMPIIKKIWSCSMILFSSGLCYLLLALSYLVTDKWKINSWWVSGLRMFGLNALAAYLLSTVFSLNHVAGYWIHGLEQYADAYYPLCVSLCEFGILFFIIRHMYRHKIFLKV